MSKWNNIGSNRKRRQAVGLRDGWKCWLCGKSLTIDDSTLDHVESPSDGGSKWSLANMKLACWTCNHTRSGGRIGKKTLAKVQRNFLYNLKVRNEIRRAKESELKEPESPE